MPANGIALEPRLDVGTEPVRHHEGFGLRRVRQDDREFIPPETARNVGAAHMPANQHAKCLEDFVSGPMPVLVVDLLELVQVQQQQRRRGAVALAPLRFPFEGVLEEPPVIQAGERVGNRLPLDGVQRTRLDDHRIDVLLVDVEEVVEQRDPLTDIAAQDAEQVATVTGHVAPQLGGLRLAEVEVRDLLQPRRIGLWFERLRRLRDDLAQRRRESGGIRLLLLVFHDRARQAAADGPTLLRTYDSHPTPLTLCHRCSPEEGLPCGLWATPDGRSRTRTTNVPISRSTNRLAHGTVPESRPNSPILVRRTSDRAGNAPRNDAKKQRIS